MISFASILQEFMQEIMEETKRRLLLRPQR